MPETRFLVNGPTRRGQSTHPGSPSRTLKSVGCMPSGGKHADVSCDLGVTTGSAPAAASVRAVSRSLPPRVRGERGPRHARPPRLDRPARPEPPLAASPLRSLRAEASTSSSRSSSEHAREPIHPRSLSSILDEHGLTARWATPARCESRVVLPRGRGALPLAGEDGRRPKPLDGQVEAEPQLPKELRDGRETLPRAALVDDIEQHEGS